MFPGTMQCLTCPLSVYYTRVGGGEALYTISLITVDLGLKSLKYQRVLETLLKMKVFWYVVAEQKSFCWYVLQKTLFS